jgi:hypothetical protein
MKRPLDSERYKRHLRHGWPMVVNLFIIMVVEHILSTALHFGITPFDWVVPRSVGEPIWEALCWSLFGLVFVLYLTGHMHSALELTVAIMAAFTLGLA